MYSYSSREIWSNSIVFAQNGSVTAIDQVLLDVVERDCRYLRALGIELPWLFRVFEDDGGGAQGFTVTFKGDERDNGFFVYEGIHQGSISFPENKTSGLLHQAKSLKGALKFIAQKPGLGNSKVLVSGITYDVEN